MRGKLCCTDWAHWLVKVVSVTMASQFAKVDKNSLQDLMVSNETKNTRKSLNYWLINKRAKNFSLDDINL